MVLLLAVGSEVLPYEVVEWALMIGAAAAAGSPWYLQWKSFAAQLGRVFYHLLAVFAGGPVGVECLSYPII